MPTATHLDDIKTHLLAECAQTKYGNAGTDRSDWLVCFAKKDIVHRGVVCLKKGDPVLFDPTSMHYSEHARRKCVTVYLARNLGGINTTRYVSEFTFLA